MLDRPLQLRRLLDRNDREMSSLVEMRDDDMQFRCTARQGRSLVSAARSQWVLWTRFETGTIARRQPYFVDFIRGSTVEILVRTVLVVPDNVPNELCVEVSQAQWHEDAADEFVFERSIEAFDDGDGAMLPERAEAGLDSVRGAPELVMVAELAALVADDVLGRLAAKRDCQVEGARHRFATGRFAEGLREDALSRVLVDYGKDAVGKGPGLAEGKRDPRHPEALTRGDGREVDMPGMPGISSGNDLSGFT